MGADPAILSPEGRVGGDGDRILLFYSADRARERRAWELTRASTPWATLSRDRVLERMKKTAAELAIPLVDPREPLRAAEAGAKPAHFQEDGHWTEVGHGIAAREIAAALASEGMLGCGPKP